MSALRSGSGRRGTLFLGALDAALQAAGLGAQLGVGCVDEERVDAAIVLNRAKARGRDAQLHRQVEAVAPQRGDLEVGQETALGAALRVADIVADKRILAGDDAT